MAAAAAEEPLPLPGPVFAAGARNVSLAGLDEIVSESTGERYQVIKRLKRALYGEVVLAHASQNRYFVIKVVDLDYPRRQLAEDPMQEVRVLQYLGEDGGGHANVVPLQEALQDSTNERKFYIVSPYAERGELFDALCDEDGTVGSFSEATARPFFRQILEGLEFLQSKGICHRDISLENFVVDCEENVMFIDFGMALRCPPQRFMTPQGSVGKEKYMPPEIFRNASFDGFKSDVWNLGVVLWTMLTGSFPFNSVSYHHNNNTNNVNNNVVCMCQRFAYVAVYRRLAEPAVQRYLHLEGAFSREAIDLLQKMLYYVPGGRWDVQQLLGHTWFDVT